jgi:hypothetical protein
MLVSEFLERLSFGQLSNLSIAGEGDGTIKPAKIPAIIQHLNTALLRIYTRFTLAEKEMIVVLLEDRTSYKLHSKFAMSRQTEFPTIEPHILDAEHDKFEDDLIRVLSVKKTGGIYLPLNDDGLPGSLYTPMVDVLQVPDPWPGAPLFVTYQAKHEKLTPTGDFMNKEIDLPAVLEDAALSYVAHKVFFHMSGQEHAATAAGHLSNYESICQEVIANDLVSASEAPTNTKFELRGFK